MPTATPIKLFNDNTFEVTFSPDPASLKGNVGTGAFTYGTIAIGTAGRNPVVLGRNLTAGISLEATAGVAAAGSELDAYLSTVKVVAPDGTCFGTVAVSSKLDLGGNANIPIGVPASIAVSGKFSGEFNYAMVKAVSSERSRADALTDLLKEVRLPLFLSFADLGENELHTLRVKFEIDLGVKASISGSQTVERQFLQHMFEDVAIKADVEAALNASLGLSLFDSLDVAVGTLGVADPNWVRVRLARAHQRRFSLGILFDLQVNYDLGSGLISLLDQVLELEPVKRFTSAVDELKTAIEPFANGDWAAIKAKIADKLSAETIHIVEQYFDIESLLNNNPIVGQVIEQINGIVTFYNELDDTVQSFWERFLIKNDLGPDSKVITALQKISALKDQSAVEILATLTGQDFSNAIILLEAFGGESLEQLITSGSGEIEAAANQAAALAQKAIDFVNIVPDTILKKWREVDEKLEIGRIVDWLDANATSVDKIKTAADNQIKKVVEKLVGKTFNLISEQDLENLKNFAAKARTALQAIDNAEASLRASFAKLKGQIGMSMGFEYERITRTEQLIDIEIDGSKQANISAVRFLKNGDIRGFLANLPEPEEDDRGRVEPLPFRLRECTFLSTKTRTTVFSFFLSGLLPFVKNERWYSRRITQSEIRVAQQNNALSRTATHSGSFVRQIDIKDSSDWIGNATLACRATGKGGDIGANYDSVDFSFLLTASRNDQQITADELQGLTRFLQFIGFPLNPLPSAAIAQNSAVVFSLRLTFASAAVSAFFQDPAPGQAGWLDIFLAAADRWLRDQLVDTTVFDDATRLGVVLATVVQSSAFKDPLPLQRLQDGLTPYTLPDGRQVKPRAFPTLPSLGVKVGTGPSALRKVRDCANDFVANQKPGDLEKLMEAFATAGKLATPQAWPNPMFLAYLILEKLRRQGFDLEPHLTGLATLRVRSGDQLGDPIVYTLLPPAT